jgi:type I site-specific restriction endonuclease
MNEAETRAGHIDPALKAAGWGAVEILANMALEERYEFFRFGK